MPEGIEKSHRHRSVQDLAVALIERPQPQPLVGENLAYKRALPVPLQAALLRNAAHLDVVAVVQFRDAARHGAAGRRVATGGRRIGQGFMRALVIVLVLEAVEGLLLPAPIAL